MRSISYVLGGKPGNLADCLDYARRHKLQRLLLTLHTREEVTEQYTVRWLQATFVWMFEDTAATYDATYGGCFQHEPKDRQGTSVDNANARLEHDLEMIRSRAQPENVEGDHQRFVHSMAYRGA